MSDELRDELTELLDVALPERGTNIRQWPDDEAEAYREFGWAEGIAAAREVWLSKGADAVLLLIARERAAALEDLAVMWERTAHLHGDAMNDADWEYLKLWCASAREYSEHKYAALRAAGTETGGNG